MQSDCNIFIASLSASLCLHTCQLPSLFVTNGSYLLYLCNEEYNYVSALYGVPVNMLIIVCVMKAYILVLFMELMLIIFHVISTRTSLIWKYS